MGEVVHRGFSRREVLRAARAARGLGLSGGGTRRLP